MSDFDPPRTLWRARGGVRGTPGGLTCSVPASGAFRRDHMLACEGGVDRLMSERLDSEGGQTMNDKPDTTTWPDVAIVLYDLLTGRKAEITYQFDNLEIFVPIASGPNPEHAVWKVNGALKVRAREDVQG